MNWSRLRVSEEKNQVIQSDGGMVNPKNPFECLKAVLERCQPSARTCVSAERGKLLGWRKCEDRHHCTSWSPLQLYSRPLLSQQYQPIFSRQLSSLSLSLALALSHSLSLVLIGGSFTLPPSFPASLISYFPAPCHLCWEQLCTRGLCCLW